MADAARRRDLTLKIGFTLRHHPALRDAHRLCSNGDIGPVTFIRAVYGHGGRPGYASEWRGDRTLAGGGELLDQGVHVIDLARWFVGDLVHAWGRTPRLFWDIGDLEDNAFALLQAEGGQVASLHTSWTQWRNRFLFEVYGRDGYVVVDGLGGSYGPERLTRGVRRPEGGPPDETVETFDEPERCWQEEWLDFTSSILDGHPPEVDGDGGVAVMSVVEAIYNCAASDSVTRVLERMG
jgi:predicted dehydrogenase